MTLARQYIFQGSIVEELSGVSQAVVAGDRIFVSGTVGVSVETGEMAEGATAQAEQALDIIESALVQADSGLHDVVRVRTFIAGPDLVNEVSRVLRRRVGMYYPANTTVCATPTAPGAVVEIEVEAIRGSGNALQA